DVDRQGGVARLQGLRGQLDGFAGEGFRARRGRQLLQVFQLQRLCAARLQINDADGVIVGIGDIELAAGDAQAARLVELRGLAVFKAAYARAREGLGGLLVGRYALDLVVVSVCDVEPAVVISDAERMLQAHFVAAPVAVAELKEVFANDRRDIARRVEISSAH